MPIDQLPTGRGRHGNFGTPRRRRILFFDHTAQLGGGEIALLNLLRCLDRSRFDPRLLCCADGPLVEEAARAGVPTRVLPLDRSIGGARKDALGARSLLRIADAARFAAYVGAVARFIRSSGADLVHTNSLKADVIGGLAALAAGRPCVWHVRDRIADDYLPAPVVDVFRLACAVVPTHVIAVSAAVLRTVFPGEPPSWATVVHDGVEPAWFELVAAPLGGNRGARIGLVGRISPHKGQDVFVEAAAVVLRSAPDVTFAVVGAALFGESEYEARVRRRVAELGIEHSFEFTGFRSDVRAVVAGLDVLVHASVVGEPFGQVIVEAMAAAKPVVATRGGGVSEIIDDGQTGLLVPMGDPGSMASAILRLLRDPARATAIARRARESASSHFRAHHVAAKVEAVYARVLAHRAPTVNTAADRAVTESPRRRHLETRSV